MSTKNQLSLEDQSQRNSKLAARALSLNLPLGGVDSHAHLDDIQYANDFAQVMERAYAAGVAYIGNVFLSAQSWQAERGRFFATHLSWPEVFFQLGIHPTEANLWNEVEQAAISEAVFEDNTIKAIGDIGLDYYWKDQPAALQNEVFAAQLKLAKKLDLPVSIHCREAEQDTLAILQNQGFRDYPLLWHCFGGNASLAQHILDQGWHISVPGTVSFKKNFALREALPLIPLNRLHLETDCPYLAPEPFRGKRNEPAYVAFTAEVVAQNLGMKTAELWLACGNNSKRLFGL